MGVLGGVRRSTPGWNCLRFKMGWLRQPNFSLSWWVRMTLPFGICIKISFISASENFSLMIFCARSLISCSEVGLMWDRRSIARSSSSGSSPNWCSKSEILPSMASNSIWLAAIPSRSFWFSSLSSVLVRERLSILEPRYLIYSAPVTKTVKTNSTKYNAIFLMICESKKFLEPLRSVIVIINLFFIMRHYNAA